MGASQSGQVADDDEEEGEEEEEEEEEGDEDDEETEQRELVNPMMKKVLEQEPELLPYHSSASPLSPQLSNFGTPKLGPQIKVWDPYNVLAPPPTPPPTAFSPSYSTSDVLEIDQFVTDVYLVNHGECSVDLSPDLVGGRWPEADLTSNGKRQARALAVFLNSQGVRFNAVYSSPLDRSRMTAISVCQELNFAEEEIQSSDELIEMSQGQWEGCLRSEIYTADMINLVEKMQPDFSAPSGESLRQVEFRMVQFLNGTVLQLPEKLRIGDLSMVQRNDKGFSENNSHVSPNSVHDQVGPHFSQQTDLLARNRQAFTRKKSGKSRLQIVTTTGNRNTEDEITGFQANNHDQLHEVNGQRSSACSSCFAIFTHAVPIKCLVTGLLGCSPALSQKICIDDSSMTVLRHSMKTGWQLKRLNDTAHLRLL